jgi:hypothetical protein
MVNIMVGYGTGDLHTVLEDRHSEGSRTAEGDRIMRRIAPLVVLIGLAAFFAPSEQAFADLLMNGDFSQPGTPPDPFAFWTTTFGDYPTNGGGFAVFTESQTSASVELEQTFTIPAGVTGLSFDFKIASPLTTASSADSFQATLFDSALNPFPTPADPNFPAFFSVDLAAPVPGQEFFSSSYVSVASLADGWREVTLFNLTRLPLPQDVTLEFLLNGTDNGQTSIVQLDNVQTLGPQSAVPEPSSLFVAVLAGSCLVVYGWTRSRKADVGHAA